MKLKSVLVTAVGLSLAAVIFAQTGQNSSSQSSSKSGNGQSGSSASSKGYSSGSSSSNNSKGGSMSGSGGGSGSGFSLNGKPTHAIMYSLDSSNMSADDKQRAFDQHTKYLGEQQGKGKVLLFGPWRDLPGSMAIIFAPSDDEATNIARNDPAVKSGALNFEVRAWNVVTPASSGFPGSLGGISSGGNNGSNGSNGSNNSSGGSTRNSGGNGGSSRGGGK